MVHIQPFAGRRLNLKVVYYGAPYVGKSANIRWAHEQASDKSRAELVCIETEGDTTLFSGSLAPLDPGRRVANWLKPSFQLFAVPGAAQHEGTKKLVLQGADAVVFVASSDPARMNDNREALASLLANMAHQNLDPKTLTVVIQWNERDLQDAVGPRKRAAFNEFAWPEFEAIASSGEGVLETLAEVQEMVIQKIELEYGVPAKGSPKPKRAPEEPAKPKPPPAQPAPARPSGSASDPAARTSPGGEFKLLIRPAPAEEGRWGLWFGLLLVLVALALTGWSLLSG